MENELFDAKIDGSTLNHLQKFFWTRLPVPFLFEETRAQGWRALQKEGVVAHALTGSADAPASTCAWPRSLKLKQDWITSVENENIRETAQPARTPGRKDLETREERFEQELSNILNTSLGERRDGSGREGRGRGRSDQRGGMKGRTESGGGELKSRCITAPGDFKVTLLCLLESVVAEYPHEDLMAEAEEEGFSNYRVVNRHFQLNTQASTSPTPNMSPKAYETPADLAQAAKDYGRDTQREQMSYITQTASAGQKACLREEGLSTSNITPGFS
ncbi:hypothetical protein PROFUN_11911 [Planoprotostelium fungivorum]|uniref:Uncharacterized protein n=1 Tax=Planoprotostelium fungivorum TaxID=1890364 RepID=A0A2P6N928_9EUKA|nr:hypothetical protein PROFUN_11911 [Planoprotostelium fungivorum]